MTDRDLRWALVVIDDDTVLLGRLAELLGAELGTDTVEIRTWRPSGGENPADEFERRIDERTVLVVTDYDLTSQGVTGLFGVSIVRWCQARLIPVGDFSRRKVAELPSEPNLFELRVPADVNAAASYVSATFRGFREVRDELARVNGGKLRSPSEALAAVLGKPELEGQLVLYMASLGSANSSLLERLRAEVPDTDEGEAEKIRVLGYVVGHVLVNAVLRYPGPILSAEALCAYIGTTGNEAAALDRLFYDGRYTGPFAREGAFYWRTDVDAILDRESAGLDGALFPTSGAFNRAVVERALDRALANHECNRCGGTNGGYLCPFTRRTVCERADCSVAANSWIPAGGDLCRIERDYYEEWAPLLGL